MQRSLLFGLIIFVAAGCGSSYPNVRQQGSISTVTFPMAFGNYSRVYNTTYHIVNRYAVVKEASYKRGVIEAELSADTSLFEKTRRTVLARLFDEGDFWDVECRVLIEVEDSDVETLGEFQPRYKWRVVGYDQFLETRLNREIKAALTGGAWESKAPLKYQGVAARSPGVRFSGDAQSASGVSSDAPVVPAAPAREGEDAPRATRSISHEAPSSGLNAEEYQRVGVHYLQVGEYAKAQSALRSSLELDSSGSSAHFLLAQSHFALGEYSKGVLSLREGFRQGQEWDEAGIDLRSFYDDPARFDAQRRSLEGHLKSFPKDTDARLMLGWVAFSTGDASTAERELSEVARERPEDVVADYYLRKARVEEALSTGAMREF